MVKIAELWAGRLYGTNTGNLFFQFKQTATNIKGIIRFNDPLYGLAVYDIEGTFDEKLILHGKPKAAARNVELGEVDVIAYLTPDGNLKGSWESTLGTAGTFDAFPHHVGPSEQDQSKKAEIPEQVYNKTTQIGSIRIFNNDVQQIIKIIRSDFKVGRAVVTFSQRGSEATKYAEDFESELSSLGDLRALKITIQEPEAYGINRVVVVELSERGPNEVRVSGVNESWVVGKAESISKEIEKYRNNLVTNYKKFGLTLNQFIFLAMLVVLPEITSLAYRAAFVAIVLSLLFILFKIHIKFIPNTLILLSGQKAGFFSRAWPSILSWVIAASSSIFAAWVYHLLTNSGNP
jgi:hypothetical protein